MYTRSRQDDNYKGSANFDYETRIIRLSPSLAENYPTNQPTSRATDKNNNNNNAQKVEK